MDTSNLVARLTFVIQQSAFLTKVAGIKVLSPARVTGLLNVNSIYLVIKVQVCCKNCNKRISHDAGWRLV